jgi:hypothetical protein
MSRTKLKPGRMKPCKHCGVEFYCQRSRDVGGNLTEKVFCRRACYDAYRRREDVRGELFWAQVDKNAPGGCWLWTGWKLNSGYGETTLFRKKILVHRLSYLWANGELPKGLHVLHRCDVPLCVNPEHLFLGTDKDNIADMYAKGRDASRGEKNLRAKLTEAQARAILDLKDTGYFKRGVARTLAEEHGVGVGAIHAIWRGASWKHIQ